MNQAFFTPTTVSFLKDLRENNYREWFEENRFVYEEHLLTPLRQLAIYLDPILKSIDPRIETSPAVGKAVFRIHRDIRFSNDKTPYRTDAWLSFKRSKKIFGNVPEFFLYFTPEMYEIGMGFYSATPAFMANFREHILVHSEEFGEILDCFDESSCVLHGEDYRKKIHNELPERFQPWLQKRNFYMARRCAIDETFCSDRLKTEVADLFLANAGLYRFLMECVD